MFIPLTMLAVICFSCSFEFVTAQNINPSSKKKSDLYHKKKKEFAKIEQKLRKDVSKYALYNDGSNQSSGQKYY